MKNTRPWLHGAIRAHRALNEELQRQAHDASAALDRSSSGLVRAHAELSAVGDAWMTHRASLRTSHQLELVYQQFHAHLQQQKAQATERHQALQLQLEHSQALLRQSRGRCRLLERLQEIGHQQTAQERRQQELQQTAESWLLSRHVEGTTE
ncbi:hypothetical protein ACS5PK_08595 [Roseateles sp. DB2]|uniref:hypothetical protein n=1 Tax=Roseateles sp. DB2 TaxID=3453717 RepID=UPI003EED4F15